MRITYRPRHPWGLVAAGAYILGAAITWFTADAALNKGTTPESLTAVLTIYVVIGVLAVGIGQLMGVAAHGAASLSGKRLEGWGKAIGLFGWSLGLVGVTLFAMKGTEAPGWLLALAVLAALFPPLVSLGPSLWPQGAPEEPVGSLSHAGDTCSVHDMEHSFSIDKYTMDGYGDVTGTGYAIGRDSEHIAGVVLESKLRAQAAQDAHQTVLGQAIVALKEEGWSVRQIAARLHGVSKSLASREARRSPSRAMPQPEIDCLVESVWYEGLQSERSRMKYREGDMARPLTYHLNIEAAADKLAE